MDVLKVIYERKSVRKYLSKPVEEEKLNKILEAARLSPSAKNMQEWKFIIVKNKDIIKKLVPACKNQTFIADAPIVIVACGTNTDYTMTCGHKAYIIDVSIAFSYMILEAYNQGLGTCWLGAFYQDEVKKILNIPDNINVVAITPLGYPDPDEIFTKTQRKKLEQIICIDSYC